MTPATRDAVRVERLTLHAADGYPLAARRYHAATPPRAHLVVGGATAVPQGFYKRFARHAASRGFDVLTLDYRGIGQSAPSTLKGFRMDYLDWGRLDLAAGVAAMRQPGVPLYLVGHSYGGHALGLLPDPGQVRAASGLPTFHAARIPDVATARHAVAVDENRLGFPPTLWEGVDEANKRPHCVEGKQHYAQRWFIGTHGDIGGGEGSPLSAAPLKWIAEGAADCGLRFYGSYARVVEHWQRFAEELQRIGYPLDNARAIGAITDNPEITPNDLVRYDCAVVDLGLPIGDAPLSRVRLPAGRYACLQHQAPYNQVFAAYRTLAVAWPESSGERFVPQGGYELYRQPPWSGNATQCLDIALGLEG